MKRISYYILAAGAVFLLLFAYGCNGNKGGGEEEITLTASFAQNEIEWNTASASLAIQSNSSWSITVTRAGSTEAAGWLVPETYTGNGNATVSFTAEQNSGERRSASVTVAAGETGRVTARATLTQNAKPSGPGPDPTPTPPAWTELPEVVTTADRVFYTHYATMNGAQARNYSLLYDKSYKTAMWVAYPMCQDHFGSGNLSSWNPDPQIGIEFQVDVSSSYGGIYSRGHQIANADRNGISAMQRQTYYFTNSTPQIQNGFNGGIWATIEGRMRDNVGSSVQDTVWVATGAVFQTVGGNETVQQIAHGSVMVYRPNYYFRVGLKKKGTGYTSIAFWLEHKAYSGVTPSNFVKTVRQVEELTGFDFFANLPQQVQDEIETRTNSSDWL